MTLTTRSAGNLVSVILNRNKRSALWAVAPIEVADYNRILIPVITDILQYPQLLYFAGILRSACITIMFVASLFFSKSMKCAQ